MSQVVLITGASYGIGKMSALLLAEASPYYALVSHFVPIVAKASTKDRTHYLLLRQSKVSLKMKIRQ